MRVNEQSACRRGQYLLVWSISQTVSTTHRSLVATNDHLLKELDETRQRHQHEVHQLHWSYDQLKRTVDWIPTSGSTK